MQKLLQIFSLESSIHGVRYIFNSKFHKSIRIYWTIFFLLSTCGLFFFAYGLYYKWSEYPDFGLKVKWRPIREVPYPGITICSPVFARNNLANFNEVMRSLQVKGENFTEFLKIRIKITDFAGSKPLNLSISQQNFLSAGTQACNPNLSESIHRVIRNASNSLNIAQLLYEMTPSVSQVFSICWFQRRKIDCEEIFTKVLTDFGYCFAFNNLNHSEIFTEEISEDFQSFRHEKPAQWSLHGGYTTQDEEAFPVRASKNSPLTFVLAVNTSDISNLCLRAGKGHRIFFHLPSEIPTLFHDEHFLAFNTERVITLSAKIYSAEQHSLKYSPVKRLSYAKNERKLRFFKSYTKSHCDLESLSNFVLSECGCVKFSMPRLNDTPVCNLSHAKCYVNAISRWPYDDERSKGKTAMPYDCFTSSDDIEYNIKLDRTSGYEAKERNSSNL